MPYYNPLCFRAQRAGAEYLNNNLDTPLSFQEDFEDAEGNTYSNIRPGLTDDTPRNPMVAVYCEKLDASIEFEGTWRGRMEFQLQCLVEECTAAEFEEWFAELGSHLMTSAPPNAAQQLAKDISGAISDFTIQMAANAAQGWFIDKKRNAYVAFYTFDIDGVCGQDLDLS